MDRWGSKNKGWGVVFGMQGQFGTCWTHSAMGQPGGDVLSNSWMVLRLETVMIRSS